MLSPPIPVTAHHLRLPRRTEQIGTAVASGRGHLFFFLFGLPFVAIGSYLTLIGTRNLPVDPHSVHAPYWVLTACGLSFAAGGIMVWGMLLRSWRRQRRSRELADADPATRVYLDYPWERRGVRKSPWPPVFKALGGVVFLAIFLSIFNWWAWLSPSRVLFIQILVSIFDLFLLWALFDLLRKTFTALKYGPSELLYGSFPAWCGKTLDLRWRPPSGMTRIRSIELTLRCIEEWSETRGTGKNRHKELIHLQLWTARHTATRDNTRLSNGELALAFVIPEKAPGTRITSDEHSFYWELEVKADVAGLDFAERYLVPIYAERDLIRLGSLTQPR
ncbi:MAG: hypothetical protein C0621_03670 [Desulfuromonas sp.]|nr:MAG: hypothetical protein C0621_03670 [Desulfuromonas sp.]